MTERIRWGIMGAGNIAGKFASDLALLPDAELVAVGSRSQETADAFGFRLNIPHRHASYAALVNDPAVDAVYVATPHTFHAENTLLALEAGKAVLCEKPFTINAREAKGVIEKARAKKILLTEGMWTRFLPIMVWLRKMLGKGIIGDVRMLTADFGFKPATRVRRLYDPALGGGALLDVGIYPVSLASMIFGKPVQIAGVAEMGPTGVDEQAAVTLRHAGGQLAALHTTIQANTAQEACITGTKGRIKMQGGWWKGSKLTVSLDDGGEEILEFPFAGKGYQFEAAAFMDCLRQGKLESPVMPLEETLSIMQTLDTLRAQWGMKYPGE